MRTFNVYLRLSVLLVIVIVSYRPVVAQTEQRSLCIAPVPNAPPRTAATPDLFCPEKLKLKIDRREPIEWPHGKSVQIDGLDASERHTVVVMCGRQSQQTFRFRFSEYKSKRACLFINDLYQTVQLWEAKQCPWCQCK